MRLPAVGENDKPSSGLIRRIQEGDIFYNCISGLRSQSLLTYVLHGAESFLRS
jgi:hypothetical protein